MSLRDALDRLIADEQARIEAADRANVAHYAAEPLRFALLWSLLHQVLDASDSRYVRASLTSTSARFQLGSLDGSDFVTDKEYDTACQSEFTSSEYLPVLEAAPGFTIRATWYSRLSSEVSDRELSFATESDVCEFLLNAIAKHIAFRKHLETLQKRWAKTAPDQS